MCQNSVFKLLTVHLNVHYSHVYSTLIYNAF